MNMRKVLRILGTIFTLSAFVFIIKSFLEFDIDYNVFATQVYVKIAIVSTLSASFFIFVGSYAWRGFLSLFGKKQIPFRSTFYIYAKSNLGKYIPGNIGHYASRQIFGVELGLKQIHLILVSVLEILYSAGAALILVIALSWDKIFDIIHELNLAGVVVAVVLSGLAIVFAFIVFFRKNKYFTDVVTLIRNIAFWKAFSLGLSASLLSLLTTGIVFAFLINFSTPILNVSHLATIVAASVTSWLIGFITPGSPGGIGVREAVLVIMLSPIITKEMILTAAVMQRATFILGDVAAWLISMALARLNCKNAKMEDKH
ncbi:MAG: lysylphosphatidylglycerol synthase domain-containing protein [Clostridiales bacterium]|jgi:uncharacterized membrane protein YbhN (UPF0104 family)|nr:lysylphosphatidylglycerol synthase domain-containing protein [Clostridiales bacterium]